MASRTNFFGNVLAMLALSSVFLSGIQVPPRNPAPAENLDPESLDGTLENNPFESQVPMLQRASHWLAQRDLPLPTLP